MAHNSRCANAKPKGRCRCSCGGKYHGISHDTETYRDHSVNENLGGEIGKIIEELKDKKIRCSCGRNFIIGSWFAYDHDGGVADKDGNKHWLYHECPYCNYQWSWWKLQRRVAETVQ
jgi:hypothetical protein